MEKHNRAVRRHHVKRLKKARAHYWGRSRQEPLTERQMGILIGTPEKCSRCWMCNRPRQTFGKPFADIRRELDLKEE